MAVAVAAVLASGCAGPVDPMTRPSARELTPADSPGLFVVESRPLGPIVVDGQGFVLYRFDEDSADPPRSRCVSECTKEWLPVPAVRNLRVVGIDRQLVGQVIRPDGSAQLTLAGWPVYGYRGDRMPGDTNGHQRDNRWYVIAPDGHRVDPADSAA